MRGEKFEQGLSRDSGLEDDSWARMALEVEGVVIV